MCFSCDQHRSLKSVRRRITESERSCQQSFKRKTPWQLTTSHLPGVQCQYCALQQRGRTRVVIKWTWRVRWTGNTFTVHQAPNVSKISLCRTHQTGPPYDNTSLTVYQVLSLCPQKLPHCWPPNSVICTKILSYFSNISTSTAKRTRLLFKTS